MASNAYQKKVHFNIGVAGFLGDKAETTAVHVKVTQILSEIKNCVLQREHKAYGVSPQDIRFDFYTSPMLADHFWPDIHQHLNMGDLCVVSADEGHGFAGSEAFASPITKRTVIANALRGVAQTSSMIDWVSCQIDIAFALWDGNEASHDGSIWSFIEHCKRNGVPCIWIDTNDLEKSFWFKNIYPEAFNHTVLWEYIDGFYIADDLSPDPAEIRPDRYLFSKLWERISARYERRRRIQPVYDKSKQSAEGNRKTANFEDRLLSSTHRLERGTLDEQDYDVSCTNYEFLRKSFHDYEKTADAMTPFIRATLFCRTWTPLWATIFLAVGFYVETIMSYLLDNPGKDILGGGFINIWTFIAGIGFLLSASMLLYNRLNIKPYNRNLIKYVVCRYVNEYLRIVLHFIAYGFPVSERILNKAMRDSDDPMKQKGAVRVRRLLRMRTPTNVAVDLKTFAYMAGDLDAYFDSQIEYQTIGRKQRFEGITRSVQKGISILLKVNLVILAVRGLLQFAVGILPPVDPEAADFLRRGGKTSVDFIRSFANMTALLITAWYDKYLRQRDMNKYGGYHHIAGKILNELSVYKKKTSEIVSVLENGGAVSYERFRSLAEDALEGLVAELYWWCDETIRQ